MTFSFVVSAMFAQFTNSLRKYIPWIMLIIYIPVLIVVKRDFFILKTQDEKKTVFIRQYLCVLKI